MDDNKIITPDASDVKDLMDAGNPSDGESLTRQQRRLQEREAEKTQKQQAKFEEVMRRPAKMAHFMALDNALKSIGNSLSETDISFVALVELMAEKGLLTKEEVMEKEQEIFEKLKKRKQGTPNSPALEESKAASETGSVERLDEVPPTVTEDDETASSRIVER